MIGPAAKPIAMPSHNEVQSGVQRSSNKGGKQTSGMKGGPRSDLSNSRAREITRLETPPDAAAACKGRMSQGRADASTL